MTRAAAWPQVRRWPATRSSSAPAAPERAVAAAQALGADLGIRGMANPDAAAAADVVIVAVPWEGHGELLRALAAPLAGKIVIDCVNPMGFDQRGAYPLAVAEGSAAQQAAAVLPGSAVVGAFHHVSAVLLLDPEVASVDLDVLVLGDDRPATDLVQALAARIPGARGVYAAAAQLRAGRGAHRRTWFPSTGGTRPTPGCASPTSSFPTGHSRRWPATVRAPDCCPPAAVAAPRPPTGAAA